MNLSQSKIKIIIGCLIAAFFAISLVFRVVLPYDSIFVGSWVKFTSNDAYYHMRLVDVLVHNFPHLSSFDPYFIYPGGAATSGVHFFDYLLATIIWIIGLGSPTQHLVDVVSAYFPAILAALTIIPAYFIGKVLFNRWVGVMAAFLMAILPGEFMGRSILGFADNHVAETLFSMVFALFLILAVKQGAAGLEGKGPMTLEHVIKRDWKVIGRPLVFSLLAGLFLGLYLITWAGALLFVFIATLYLIVQFIVNQFKHKSSDHLGITGFVIFLVALVIFLPLSPGGSFSLVMVAAVLIPPVLFVLSRLISNRSPILYPAALIVAGGVFFGIFYVISPSAISTMWTNFLYVFAPGGGSSASTTMEMQPFLSPFGAFSTEIAWGNFTTSFFLLPGVAIPGFGLVAFGILIWLSIKQRGEKEHQLLFIIWTVVIATSTLVQRRFAYYLVVNIAVLSAFISWEIFWLAGLRHLSAKPEITTAEEVEARKAKTKKKRQTNPSASIYYVSVALAIIVVFFAVDFFNISKSKEVASTAPFAPSDGWEESLHWVKDNTPEPLGPDAYYKLYTPDYKYPASAYGVTAWWDYGYWILRTAQRLPSANPSQDPGPIIKVANLFLSTNATTADIIMADLKSDYIIADYSLVVSKLYAVADWAGQLQSKYYSVYYVSDQGSLSPRQLLTPDFYRTMLVRLYSFDGKAVPDGKPLVITYNDVVSGGVHIKQATAAKEYSSYKAAQDFIATQKSGNYDIVGSNPFISPIPLDAVTDFKLVHSSLFRQPSSENTTIPEIKIFEHLK